MKFVRRPFECIKLGAQLARGSNQKMSDRDMVLAGFGFAMAGWATVGAVPLSTGHLLPSLYFSTLASVWLLAGMLPEQTKKLGVRQLTFGGVPLPQSAEPLGIFVVGSPGQGKTMAINGNLTRIRWRGERVLMLDAGGEALSGWWQAGDMCLNPLDERSRGSPWSPLAEMTSTADAVGIAGAITGEPDENERGEWLGYARDLIAAVLAKLWLTPSATNKDLLYWLTLAPRADLQALIADEPISRQFEPGAERMLSSILGIVGSRLQPFRSLDPEAGKDSFSLRRWATDSASRAWVWFPYREDHARGLKPLLRAVVESAATALLSQPTQRGRRIWFVLDEFASVGKVDKLLDLLSKGRKKGGCAIIGTQAIGQIDSIWGKDARSTIRNCLQTLVALSAADQETCKWVSDDIGETVYLIEKTSVSQNDAGGVLAGGTATTTTSTNYEICREPLIRPATIKDMPPLRAILKISGLDSCFVDIPVVLPPHQVPPFIPRKDKQEPTAGPTMPAPVAPPIEKPEL
jgi:hypothetical protein